MYQTADNTGFRSCPKHKKTYGYFRSHAKNQKQKTFWGLIAFRVNRIKNYLSMARDLPGPRQYHQAKNISHYNHQ
jgi:hypothetical protein